MEQNVAELPLSHKALAWFEQNRKQAVWGAVIIAVVGVTVWFIVSQRAEKQARASRALSDVILAQAGFGGPVKESPEAYLKVVADYPNSSAAARALLLAAGAYFNEGKYSDAEAQFQRFLREHRDSPQVGEALLGVAACLDAQGKTDQAITAYKDLIARHPTDNVIPHAKFALARLYETQNKPELARDLYQQIDRDNRFSSMADEAGVRLKELIEKNPSLAPPPAPAPAPFSITPALSPSNVLGSNPPPALKQAGTNVPVAPQKP